MHRYFKNGKVPVSNIVQVGYGNKCILYIPSQENFIFIFLLRFFSCWGGGGCDFVLWCSEVWIHFIEANFVAYWVLFMHIYPFLLIFNYFSVHLSICFHWLRTSGWSLQLRRKLMMKRYVGWTRNITINFWYIIFSLE